MTALQIATARGLTDSEKIYIDIAEERVRLYLAYKDDEDISPFASVIADIALALRDRQKAITAAQAAYTAGLTSKSYTEGPVSVHETYGDATGGAEISASYDKQVDASLASIARYRRVRVVKC